MLKAQKIKVALNNLKEKNCFHKKWLFDIETCRLHVKIVLKNGMGQVKFFVFLFLSIFLFDLFF